MGRKNAAALVGLSLIVCSLSAQAASCAIGFAPKTGGFVLNPILDQLTVTSVKPASATDDCKLRVGDEILQVNERPILGSRALSVMKYWKSLKKDAAITFRVKRDGEIVIVVAD